MGSTIFAADRIWTLIVCFLHLSLQSLKAQEADFYQPGFFRYSNYIYHADIRTVILEPLKQVLTNPVISLGTTEQLVLKFDDMGDETENYSYRFIHCTSNWEPSPLSESDFINGFYTEVISTYKHSLSTLQPYLHYRIEFPTETMSPKISGNYLLVVFYTAEPEKTVLTQRFMVRENKVEINARIHQATNIDLRYTHQETDFSIVTNGIALRNPYGDLKVQIVQNNRWDMVNKELKPLYVTDNKLDYDLEDQNTFPGTNEFRFSDLRTIRFETVSMEMIRRDSITLDPIIILKKDQRKSYERYASTDDINGRSLIKIYEGRDGDLEADYLKVKFRLAASMPFDSSLVYLFGGFNNWNLDTKNRMSYSTVEKAYTLDVWLKQGYYNYQYLVKPSAGPASASETEGDHFETSNEYAFYVYWADPSLRYERLVGYRVFNSVR